MADVERVTEGSYTTPEGPGHYMRWRIEDDAGALDCRVTAHGHPGAVVRNYDLSWGTELDRDTFSRLIAGDHWLGGNPVVRVYKERLGADNPLDLGWADYRYFAGGYQLPRRPDAVEFVNGEPPERYTVSWDAVNRVDDAAPFQAALAVNPAAAELLPDNTIADQVGMYLRMTRPGDPDEALDAIARLLSRGDAVGALEDG